MRQKRAAEACPTHLTNVRLYDTGVYVTVVDCDVDGEWGSHDHVDYDDYSFVRGHGTCEPYCYNGRHYTMAGVELGVAEPGWVRGAHVWRVHRPGSSIVGGGVQNMGLPRSRGNNV